MAIVGRAKYTRACEILRRRDAPSPRNFLGARVYFARHAIAIAKIRDYSQSIETCIFKRLHFGKRFQMYPFLMKTIAFSDRFSVDVWQAPKGGRKWGNYSHSLN